MDPKKILDPKKFLDPKKIFWPKKFWTPKNWIKKFWTPKKKILDIQLYYWGLPIAKVRLLSLSFYTACSLSFYTAWHTALYNMEKDILNFRPKKNFGPKKFLDPQKLNQKILDPQKNFGPSKKFWTFNCITEDCRLPRSAYFHFRFILPVHFRFILPDILPYITWKKIFCYCITATSHHSSVRTLNRINFIGNMLMIGVWIMDFVW